MKKIKSISLFRLRNSEHYLFHSFIYSLLNTINFRELKTFLNRYNPLVEREAVISKKISISDHTEKIKHLYELRHDYFMILKKSIELDTSDNKQEIRQAAIRLKKFMNNNYKGVSRISYSDSIGKIKSMIDNLQNPPHKADVEFLNYTKKVENLSNSNLKLEEVFDQRSDVKKAREIQGTMKEIRPMTDGAYRALVNAVNTFYEVELGNKNTRATELLGPIIDKVNSRVEQCISDYERRLKRKKAEKVEEGEEGKEGGKVRKRKKVKKDDWEMDDTTLDIETGTNETPNLSMTAQTLIGQSAAVEGAAAQMTVMAVDPAAFALATYPMAINGVVRLKYTDDAWTDFPVAGFLMDDQDQNAVGLILNPPTPSTAFSIPLNTQPPQPAEIRINDKLLATLDGIGYPDTITTD